MISNSLTVYTLSHISSSYDLLILKYIIFRLLFFYYYLVTFLFYLSSPSILFLFMVPALFIFVYFCLLLSSFLFSFAFILGSGPESFALRFVRTKEGELTYQCGLCGYLPNSTNKSIGYAKNRVCMHIRNVHSEPTNVVCGGCSKRFKNKESLRVHKIKYCRDEPKPGGNAAATPEIGIN